MSCPTVQMDEIDAMFSHLLGEMDQLSQSLNPEGDTTEVDPTPPTESGFSVGFTDLNESLNELEDHELDDLVADLGANSKQQEVSAGQQKEDQNSDLRLASPDTSQESEPVAAFQPITQEKCETQTKADKIKLALEKLKEAKMIVKVWMADGSTKTLMVDERQTVRDVLDKLVEKTHCDRSIDWSLCETSPELQTERGFEDHECLTELLSAWTQHSENKLCFLSRPEKYVMFREPQLFYMWRKEKACWSGNNKQVKELLIEEHFGRSTLIVPDLEDTLYLKDDGKKVWKPRYFVLRASGIYYAPKGKTKSSSDLACFIRFENVNIYTAHNYKQKYRAPTNFCFLLKHPSIQKESHYIKFLCCDNKHTQMLWVNSIRIAKYGTHLYKTYQAALREESRLQTPLSSADKSTGDTPDIQSPLGPSSSKITSVEDYPHEPPPDFIPPPPPPPPPPGSSDIESATPSECQT